MQRVQGGSLSCVFSGCAVEDRSEFTGSGGGVESGVDGRAGNGGIERAADRHHHDGGVEVSKHSRALAFPQDFDLLAGHRTQLVEQSEQTRVVGAAAK